MAEVVVLTFEAVSAECRKQKTKEENEWLVSAWGAANFRNRAASIQKTGRCLDLERANCRLANRNRMGSQRMVEAPLGGPHNMVGWPYFFLGCGNVPLSLLGLVDHRVPPLLVSSFSRGSR